MKEAFKLLDNESFDFDEEALSVISVSVAQYAVKLGIIEELEKIATVLDTFNDLTAHTVNRQIRDRIKYLQSKTTKLNDPS